MVSVAHRPGVVSGGATASASGASLHREPENVSGDPPHLDHSGRAKRAATWATSQGLTVIPYATPGRKYPTTPDWENRGYADGELLAHEWPKGSTAYGVLCGPSGLLVVDCDLPKPDTPPPPAELGDVANGLDALTVTAAIKGEPLPRTFSVRTPSGGLHLYYRNPAGVDLGNTVKSLTWCVDTRGRGGQVVGPGSTINGLSYEVADWAPPAELPAWIVSRLTGPQTASQRGAATSAAPSEVRLSGSPVGPEWAAAALEGEAARIREAPDGQGNHVVNAAAYTVGRLVGAQLLSRDVAEAGLAAALDTWVFRTPGDRQRMLRTLKSGLADGERSPRTIAPREHRRRSA